MVTDIYNQCVNQCSFPNIWKKTVILPLTKTNSPTELTDLRPIALICSLGKVFEKLIIKQLNKYINDHSLISINQFGYRSGFGTEACLLKLISDINGAIDRQMITISVLFDLSKAFDNVNHSILLEKLKRKNFSNDFLKLLHSYLSNRTIAVTDDSNNLSSWHNVSCGVPQGSILGPLLFILYADDLHSNMKYSTSISYVDDTQIYLHCYSSDIANGLKKIESDANSFVMWCKNNCFQVNIRKTMAIIYGTSPAISSINFDMLDKIIVDGQEINFVNEVKNLGIWFDSCLTWKKHITVTIGRISSVLYSLKLHKHSLSFALRKNLIESLIFPIIDYGSPLLLGITDELNKKLEIAINNCIRFIFKIPRWLHISGYRDQLLWLKVKFRRFYFLGCLLYKIVHFKIPAALIPYFKRTDSIKDIRRSKRTVTHTFVVSHSNIVTCQKSFPIAASQLWNKLPQNISNLKNFDSFKLELFNYLVIRQNIVR